MLISLVKYPVTTLGPGKRIGIWTSGCKKRCEGCMSPHAWDFDETLDCSLEDILLWARDCVRKGQVDGVTISGGEPFDQPGLKDLLVGLQSLGIEDVLVYTGYYKAEIPDYETFQPLIGVLVDGPYEKEKNDNLPLRGSSNQHIYIQKQTLVERYAEYLQYPRTFDVEVAEDVTIVIGLLPKS